jgi:hypothetical protein
VPRRVDVGDHADLAAVVGQAFGEDGIAAVFETAASTERFIRMRFADPQLAQSPLSMQRRSTNRPLLQASPYVCRIAQEAGDQAGNGGLAEAAADADHRDAAVVAIGEQFIDNGATDRAWLAAFRLEVHQQAGTGIDLDNRTALAIERLRNVFADQVDAGDVESDDARGERGGGRRLRVHEVGDIIGVVAAAHDQDFATGRRDRIRRKPLPRNLEPGNRVVGQGDDVEREFLGGTASRVGVDLAVDQFVDRRTAITDDPGGLAAGGGDQLAANDQQAVLRAAHVAFDDDAAAFDDGRGIGRLDFFARIRLVNTPRAWLPSDGLTTTGSPISSAASQASSALSTRRPSGTGTPHDFNSILVRSLSREMPSAMALVRSVSAVQMRRLRAP